MKGGLQMKKMMMSLFFSLMVMFFLSGCNSNATNSSGDVFQYKDSFVGDNSAVGNIVNKLPGAENLNDFELRTKEEPYGIILNYNEMESEKEFQETVVYNATFLFVLIQNVDLITFHSDDREYTVTKDDLQEWYSIDLNEIQKENELRKLINDFLEDESKVNQFLK
jgi:hypothetical protein